ncbi:MAG: calcium/sodium antiporter [Myxococcota bacterium]|nr:calcium/sodium antiporter [Myxococcota bacterium]
MGTSILLLIAGLAALIVGADLTVAGARIFARRLGLSELVIGLTLTSIGTSLPELATSASAAIASESGSAAAGVAVGNLLGSNLFLITALLGMSAVARTIRIEPATIWRDGGTLMVATVAALAVMVGGEVHRLEGILLVLGYLAYLAFVAVQERRRLRSIDETDPETDSEPENGRLVPWWISSTIRMCVGLAGVLVGADMVVDHGVSMATIIGVPGTLIGIFVGVGTSLPELVVSVQAALRGSADISVGNIVGSGITNLLLCLGAAAGAHAIAVPPAAVLFDLPFLLVTTAIAIALMLEGFDVTRAEGTVLCLLFVLYLYLRIAGMGF